MKFVERDGEILLKAYTYDGLLPYRYIKNTWWADKSDRAALKRLAKLVNSGYLAKPTPYHRKTQPMPEAIYWIGWRGIIWVAAQYGVRVEEPPSDGENQMRRLAKELRDEGIHWLRVPRWTQLFHDLAVFDFRLAVEATVESAPGLHLEEWIHESSFRSRGDTITYQVMGNDKIVRKGQKRVYPDSYFSILEELPRTEQKSIRARFLLEIDQATHPLGRWGDQKVAPGLCYISSPEYKDWFGDNSGRWLILTTGKTRKKHLMDQTEQVAGDGTDAFLFSTFDQLNKANILLDPVWQSIGKDKPVALFSKDQLIERLPSRTS